MLGGRQEAPPLRYSVFLSLYRKSMRGAGGAALSHRGPRLPPMPRGPGPGRGLRCPAGPQPLCRAACPSGTAPPARRRHDGQVRAGSEARGARPAGEGRSRRLAPVGCPCPHRLCGEGLGKAPVCPGCARWEAVRGEDVSPVRFGSGARSGWGRTAAAVPWWSPKLDLLEEQRLLRCALHSEGRCGEQEQGWEGAAVGVSSVCPAAELPAARCCSSGADNPFPLRALLAELNTAPLSTHSLSSSSGRSWSYAFQELFKCGS